MIAKIVKTPTIKEISLKWDEIAPLRSFQIYSGKDITFNKVLSEFIISQIKRGPILNVIDAGCGVGALVKKLAPYACNIVGVDPSIISIEIARLNNPDAIFYNSTLEEFCDSEKLLNHKFDIIIANMVLMDTIDVFSFANSAKKLMARNGKFVFTITHPIYWPKYAGYENEPWFNSDCELFIEDEFRISLFRNSGIKTIHVHRPINMYKEILRKSGFKKMKFYEIMPSKEVELLYPQPWKWPRYLGCVCS